MSELSPSSTESTGTAPRSSRVGVRGVAIVVVVLATVLSGCAALPLVGPSCGPGETDIGAVEGNVSSAEIKGELRSLNDSVMVIDDGTGQAELLVVGDLRRDVSAGDCIIARGEATADADGEREVVMIPSELYREEYRSEE